MWLVLLAAVALAGDPSCSSIKRDEEVVFFNSYGYRTVDGREWVVPVHGWVYEPEEDSFRRGVLLEALERSLGIEGRQVTATFTARARLFLVDNERGKQVCMRLGEQIASVGESEANGHFRRELRFPASQIDGLVTAKEGQPRVLEFQAVLPAGDDRRFVGLAELLAPEGLSVISDIDDTIKVTQVRDREALLTNTLMREFRPVAGMAEVYRDWSKRGVSFHYVSACPWQLYTPLTAFLERSGFPSGSIHMKLFRWKDSTFLDLFSDPEETKRRAIVPLLRAFAGRRFILIGDSGEKDPEIYGSLAREYSSQIVRIIILDVTNEPAEGGRYRQAFSGVPRQCWHVVRGAEELKRLDIGPLGGEGAVTSRPPKQPPTTRPSRIPPEPAR